MHCAEPGIEQSRITYRRSSLQLNTRLSFALWSIVKTMLNCHEKTLSSDCNNRNFKWGVLTEALWKKLIVITPRCAMINMIFIEHRFSQQFQRYWKPGLYQHVAEHIFQCWEKWIWTNKVLFRVWGESEKFVCLTNTYNWKFPTQHSQNIECRKEQKVQHLQCIRVAEDFKYYLIQQQRRLSAIALQSVLLMINEVWRLLQIKIKKLDTQAIFWTWDSTVISSAYNLRESFRAKQQHVFLQHTFLVFAYYFE